MKLKILFFDIETAPALAYIWSPAEGFVQAERMIKDSFMLSWAAKWEGEKQVRGDVLTSQEAKDQDDSRIVKSLAALVREADIVVAHNINKFDLPKLNTRLMALGLEPLGPVRTIDTYVLVKQNFALAYNNLNYVAKTLKLGKKIKTDFSLWRRCYLGSGKALKQMLRYNKQDVVLLEAVYEALKPYVRNLPRLVDGGSGCPCCASERLTKRGFYRTNASVFQRFQCKDCGRFSRARKAEASKKSPFHPL